MLGLSKLETQSPTFLITVRHLPTTIIQEEPRITVWAGYIYRRGRPG
jgi:hypothetical protein